jgi:hypothetical protein
LIIERAMARMRARQFAAGAADIELWISVNEMTEGQDDPSFSAFAALARMAAGDAARAAEHERRARELIADLPGGTAGGLTPAMLDLLQIWRMAREGNLTQARVLFANRTGWEVASGQLVSEVARLLQAGATPAERVGHLEGDPARFGREEIARYRTRFNEVKNRFSAIRLAIAPGQFSRFAPHLARTDRSRYFTRQNDPQMPGRYLSVERDGDGIPSGYALLLHTALTAQAEGRSSFLLMPGRTEIFSAMTRIGNSGDEGMVAPLSFDAAAVVRDLGPLFPPPEPQRRR